MDKDAAKVAHFQAEDQELGALIQDGFLWSLFYANELPSVVCQDFCRLWKQGARISLCRFKLTISVLRSVRYFGLISGHFSTLVIL